MMPTDFESAQRALVFAQEHDWGENAWLDLEASLIVDLADTYTEMTDDGVQGTTIFVSRPATIEAMREFGQY